MIFSIIINIKNNPFQDFYLRNYLLKFLRNCDNCNKMDIVKYCCVICNIFYCSNCDHNYRLIAGFYNNKYCYNCHQEIFFL